MNPEMQTAYVKRQQSQALKAGLIIGLFFIAVPAIILGVILRDSRFYFASAKWPRVQAVVETSAVKEGSGSKGKRTYNPQIIYSYDFGGRHYTSSRYSFFDSMLSGQSSSRHLVSRYPAGSIVTALIDPLHPERAVISREIPPRIMLPLGVLGVFFLFGLFIMFLPSRLVRRTGYVSSVEAAGAPGHEASPQSVRSPWLGHAAPLTATPGGEFLLTPMVGAGTKAAALAIFALIWNGIIAVFLWQVITGWMSGRAPIFLTVFMVPFVLIGLAVLGGAVYFFLQIFNPAPLLYLSMTEARPGDTLSLRWEFKGNADKITDIAIWLRGTERSMRREGKSKTTKQEVFFQQEVAAAKNYGALRSGNASIKIPERAIHSFQGGNNAIVWSLDLHASIEKWPDISESYPIRVLPAEKSK